MTQSTRAWLLDHWHALQGHAPTGTVRGWLLDLLAALAFLALTLLAAWASGADLPDCLPDCLPDTIQEPVSLSLVPPPPKGSEPGADLHNAATGAAMDAVAPAPAASSSSIKLPGYWTRRGMGWQWYEPMAPAPQPACPTGGCPPGG